MLHLSGLCPFLILHFVRCFVDTDAGPRYKQRIETPFPRSLRNSFEVYTALRFLKKKIIFYEVEEIILAQIVSENTFLHFLLLFCPIYQYFRLLFVLFGEKTFTEKYVIFCIWLEPYEGLLCTALGVFTPGMSTWDQILNKLQLSLI